MEAYKSERNMTEKKRHSLRASKSKLLDSGLTPSKDVLILKPNRNRKRYLIDLKIQLIQNFKGTLRVG